jgi:zinc protease
VVRADARVAEPRFSRLWLAPSYKVGETKYAYALQVLARLFGGSETSRLSRVLVEERKIGLSAWASYGASSLGLTSFDIGVHPAKSRSIEEVEEAVTAEMKKLLDGGVTAEEVERAQNQLLARRDLFAGFRWPADRASTARRSAPAAPWPMSMPGRSAFPPSRATRSWRPPGLSGATTAPLLPF